MDVKIFNFIHNLSGQHGWLDFLGIFFAEYLAYILITVFIVLIFLEKKWQKRCYNFFFGLLSLLIARGVMVELIRFFYQRPRPYVALVFKPLIDMDFSPSFPSGHATLFFALATVVFFTNKRWSYYFLAGAVFMGIARVYVGVHWPLDILGGAVLGFLSAFIVWKILPRYH